MSGVYVRNRSLSELQWIMTAKEIRKEIDQIAHSEKVIPKSWRFTHALPLCEEAKNLVHHTRRAYDRYPNTAKNVRERKEFLTLALDDCYDLVDDLQELKDVGLPINLNRFKKVADMLDAEIGMLKGLRKNTRLTGKAPVEERIAKLEMQLADLRGLEADE
jgi:hypothetical protein